MKAILFKQTMKLITIKNKEYKIKQTLRALFIFEQITGRPFEIKTMLDNYIFFYSVIIANNPDNILDWDDFIDALDESPNLLTEFTELNQEQNKVDTLFNSEDSKEEKKKLSISELYSILVLQLNYPPDYVLDKMEIYEINAAMKYSYYKHKDSWEQTRLIAFLIAQTNSKKHLELSDIIKFKWDEEIIEDNIITEKQREELIKKANQYIINNE